MGNCSSKWRVAGGDWIDMNELSISRNSSELIDHNPVRGADLTPQLGANFVPARRMIVSRLCIRNHRRDGSFLQRGHAIHPQSGFC